MPARKPKPPDEKPQFERFIETAREVGAGETDAELERVIDKIMPSKRIKKSNPRKLISDGIKRGIVKRN